MSVWVIRACIWIVLALVLLPQQGMNLRCSRTIVPQFLVWAVGRNGGEQSDRTVQILKIFFQVMTRLFYFKVTTTHVGRILQLGTKIDGVNILKTQSSFLLISSQESHRKVGWCWRAAAGCARVTSGAAPGEATYLVLYVRAPICECSRNLVQLCSSQGVPSLL
jgi:hypothetical protein